LINRRLVINIATIRSLHIIIKLRKGYYLVETKEIYLSKLEADRKREGKNSP